MPRRLRSRGARARRSSRTRHPSARRGRASRTAVQRIDRRRRRNLRGGPALVVPQSRARTAHRRDHPRNASRRLRQPVLRGLADHRRIRAHRHHRAEHLSRAEGRPIISAASKRCCANAASAANSTCSTSPAASCRPIEAARKPVLLVASGPTGGVMGSLQLAQEIGHRNIITTDMGGTSFDVGTGRRRKAAGLRRPTRPAATISTRR